MNQRRSNQIVQYDQHSRYIDIWHLNDAGDLREMFFELPANLQRRHVEKAFLYHGRRWIDWLSKQGIEVVPETIRPHGPYPCAEYDKLDMQRYVISARAKRSRPERRRMVDAEQLFAAAPERDGGVGDLFAQPSRMPKLIEANALQQREAQRRTDEMRRSWEEMDRDRAVRGLPRYQEGDG